MKLARNLARRISVLIERVAPSWPIAFAIGLWLLLFWPLMSGRTVVGFRDSAYFFYPYYQWIDQTWAAGEIPLWNPFCDLGYPVIGDTTSAVFYPGKIIFSLRFLSYPSRYGLFISVHVLLAGIGAYWFTRRMGASMTAATLAAVSYALGGSVLFQSTNVIYLVSAALLPFALSSTWNMFRHRHPVRAVSTGVFLGLLVLGGDPQMAYVVGLITVALAMAKVVKIGNAVSFNQRHAIDRFRLARFTFRQISIALFVAATLSAVQILPGVNWARDSRRADAPYSSFSQWWDPIQDGSRLDEIYQFSQPPWSLMELFWPNVSGRPYPTDQRWAGRLPAADRMWTPSLYMGLPAILLGLSAMRMTGRRRRHIWLTKIALFFALASFGWYGAVWLFNEIASVFGWEGLNLVASPVGGLYWMMLVALPKFYLFRYPAKLFVVASLAICVLAGLQLSRPRRSPPISFWLPGIVVGGLAIFVFCLGIAWPVTGELRTDPDPMFGPFDQAGVQRQWWVTLTHTTLVASLLCLVMWAGIRCAGAASPYRRSAVMILFVSMVDLWIANCWLVPQLSSDVFESSTSLQPGIEKVTADEDLPHLRFQRSALVPRSWRQCQSTQRLQEIVSWQRETLHPKHHLALPVNLIGSFTSIEHAANADFVAALSKSRLTGQAIGPDVKGFRIPRLKLISAGELASIPATSAKDESRLDTFLLLADEQGIDRVQWSNTRVRCQVTCKDRAVLFFNSLPFSGWRIRAWDVQTGRPLPDCRIQAGKYFLAAMLPPGTSRVEFHYWPREFWVGALVSLLSVVSLCLFAVYRLVQRRSSRSVS